MLQGQSSVARIGKESVGDPLIACILFVAQHFGQTFQRGALSSLARDERGFLPFHQAEAALDLCFINNERLHSRKVRGFARDRMAHFKVPTRYEFVDELPKTATGKIQKFVLRGGQSAIAAQ